MKQDIPLSQTPYSAPYTSLGAEICDNWYLEAGTSPTGKARFYHVGAQGLHRLIEATNSNPCRGLYTTSGNRTFGVWGNGLYELTAQGAAKAQIGTLLTSAGVVRFAENGFQMIVVDGSYGYILELTSGAFAQITDEYFPGINPPDPTKGPSHVACIDTYFLVNSRGSNRYYWSAPYYTPYAFDSTKPTIKNLWWGLDYGQKIGDTDHIVALIANKNLLLVMGQNSAEYHYDTGDSYGQLFRRMDSALVGVGCSAPDSVCSYEDTVFFLGRSRAGTLGMFKVGLDFQPTRISTRGIETRIAQYSSISDCWAYTFFIDGHAYASWNFPSGTSVDGGDVNGATWLYDITNGTWTRRTRWDSTSGESYRWAAQFATYNWSRLIMGDGSTDAVYELDGEHYVNDHPTGSGVDYINRTMTGPIGYDNNKRLIYDSLQLQFQQGMGLRTGQGSEPYAMMAMSRDAGFTFGYERLASIGKTGEYAYRTIWRKCGMGRNMVPRFRITEPIRCIVHGLTAEIRECIR